MCLPLSSILTVVTVLHLLIVKSTILYIMSTSIFFVYWSFLLFALVPEEEKQNLQLKDNISEKYALVHEKDVHREGGIYSSLFVRRATIMSLWFLCSFTSIVLNKYILSYLNVDAGILGRWCNLSLVKLYLCK